MSEYFDKFVEKALNPAGDSDSHLALLYALVLNLRAKNILELGVRNGDSTLPLLAAAQKTGGFLNSVDTVPTGFKPPQELKEHWKFNCIDAIGYLQTLNENLDLVFIDDWHDGMHVYNEIRLIEPWITKKSIILLHDTMHSNSVPDYILEPPDYDVGGRHFGNGGPYGALLRLLSESPKNWEYSTVPSCNGLTILRKIN
jgi:predicted O-methyltransferase YrrM